MGGSSEVLLIVIFLPLNPLSHPPPFFVLLNFNLLGRGGLGRRGSNEKYFFDKREGLEIFLAETLRVGIGRGGREKQA